MAVINITGFGGIAPKKHPRFLDQHQAQIAENCKLVSGALSPWRAPLFEQQLAKAGPIQTIYKFGDLWLHWQEDVDVVRGPVSGVERLYFTGTDAPRVTDASLADIGGSGDYPESSYLLGIPAPTNAPTAALNGVHTTPQATAYVYTFVSEWGEEGPPSPVSNVVNADFTTGSVDLTTMDLAPAGDYNIAKWRIYRILSGTAGAEYQFVAEVGINGGTPQYNDSINNDALGEVLPSTDWDPPPSGLVGLTRMNNGIIAGFVGNTVYFCEPFLPHAWPADYAITVDEDIVGLSAYGSTLVVLTKSNPILITGTDPSRMSETTIRVEQPCINKRSIVRMGDGVAYATHNGIYYIGRSGHRMLTEQELDFDAWQAYNPNTGPAGYYNGRYFIFFNFTESGLVFGPDDDLRRLRSIRLNVNALHYSKADGSLYGVIDTDSGVPKVYQLDGNSSKMVFTWRSKKITPPGKSKYTAARIYADYAASLSDDELAALAAEQARITADNAALITGGLVDGAINAHAIGVYPVNGSLLEEVPQVPSAVSFVFKLIVDDVVVHEVTIDDNKPFRLPDLRGQSYEIEVSGEYPISQVKIATSIRELQGQ